MEIFNELLAVGQFPDAWRQFLIFLLPRNAPNKFRPIALASCLLKLCEKVAANRLKWWLETNRRLPIFQYGFRVKRSCGDNLAVLSTEIFTGYSKNQYTAVVFLDIKGAFDNVDRNTLYRDLAKIGINEKLANFVYFLLASRLSYFVVQGELEGPYPMNKGTGQGSVLSPILFNIYLSFLPDLSDLGVEIIAFADDVVLLHRSSNLENSLNKVETATKRIASHLESKSLEISPEKSHLVIFSMKHFTPTDHHITINRQIIKAENSARFLGVELDYRMTFKPHIQNLLHKCTRVINMLNSPGK